ncbi:MAG: hypothetical protein ABJG88_07260 [Litorimonas sp.]
MSVFSMKARALPVIAAGAALALSACASNGANNFNNGFGVNGFDVNGFNSGAYNVQNVKPPKLPKTRYGGQYFVDESNNCCQPVTCCQPVPVQRPVIEVQNIVEVPAPEPEPIIEYVYEQPVYETPPPAPVYVPEPAPVYEPAPAYEPAPVYTPPPVQSCPEGQIPAYGGQGCIPIVPLRK